MDFVLAANSPSSFILCMVFLFCLFKLLQLWSLLIWNFYLGSIGRRQSFHFTLFQSLVVCALLVVRSRYLLFVSVSTLEFTLNCFSIFEFLAYQGYGCPGLSITGSAIATAEVARVDASCSTFILVHSSLAMLTICKYLELTLCYHTLGTVRYYPCFS